ncbi:DUF1385 domain-containing protein [Clostridium cochlearium]|uniref:DUF1385 domain-containing protein n=1 Tax=Clostridium cochlearium TaxID=1494 RepID=A0A239YZR3_CLOCO|nr:DUF1385 domain-containing protein [Clostridium cochlearium]NSJ91042.1 DUF1385 domain-containing protein [Coprococcus sp. MSK.21.13]MBE6065516.1 DUF1385 domain-containing protein [Clostridium cochlearium]MBU5270088.1 DUF1385 domain-containing protein [Clostridium cochlearium]MCG4579907.1 DUF1385 domain-containing protein [Clostridium cochlearium]NMA58875.1 DUF1385 domain-containing protein [Clostridium cochlearium]
MKKQCNVGGQAVMEGVMMRGTRGIATAVRKSDGEIVMDIQQFTPYSKRNKFFSMPIIRGFISLIESLVIGIKTLNYSASFFEEDDEKSKFNIWIEKKFGERADNIIITIVMCVSFFISIGLFVVLPTVIANLFKKLGVESSLVLNIIEGIIRVGIFLSYIYIIGKMDDINRFFQYHGAEHKTIFCYESSEELTAENVKKHSRFHPRCGTNFLFLVMIVSIIIFSFTGWNSLLERMMYRIILIPVVSGTTYEIIKWLGKSQSKIAKIIAAPGLALQRLTTREPDTSQIEVAIKALKGAEGIEN